MQEDDFALFKSAVRGVKPIEHDRADTGKPRSNRAQIATRRANAVIDDGQTRR
jgi:DNA-nicking Smr family endonuclease